MPAVSLENFVRQHRDASGLTQKELALQAGVTRQAVLAIETGRHVPSTALALRLARALHCDVERLFRLAPEPGLDVRVADRRSDIDGADSPMPPGTRVAVGRVGDRWAAHRLPNDYVGAADGVLAAGDGGVEQSNGVVHPFLEIEQLGRNVLVAGCAPLIGILSERVEERFHDARSAWIPASSHRALDLLEDGLVHVAGVHLSVDGREDENVAAVRNRFGGRRMLLVNLTRWRQGLVVPAGNPLSIRGPADLLRPGLRFVRREAGAGANQLVSRLLSDLGGTEGLPAGPVADGHVDVARRVRWDAADVGVAIESVALAAGLEFVPLSEERFDLAIPADLAEEPPTARLLEALDHRAFRTEVAHLPGYDGSTAGHVISLDVA